VHYLHWHTITTLPADASDTRLQHQNRTLLKEYQLAVLDFRQDLALSPAILDKTEEESTEVKIARLLADGCTKELLPQHSLRGNVVIWSSLNQKGSPI
jgi:hypothetical protein